jgi:hypothetical protein
MNKYIKYYKYLKNHRKNTKVITSECLRGSHGVRLALACMRYKHTLYSNDIFHDFDKFLPSTFFAYANLIYGEKGKNHDYFKSMQDKHHVNSKHHWHYWVLDDMDGAYIPQDIPMPYILTMIIDMKAMAIRFGGSAQKYYIEHYHEFILTRKTRIYLEFFLELIDTFDVDQVLLCEKVEYLATHAYGEKSLHYDTSIIKIEDKYGVDVISIKYKEV